MRSILELVGFLTMVALIGACSGEEVSSESTAVTAATSAPSDTSGPTTVVTAATTPSTAPAEARASDPCALLGAADLDAATGLTFGEGTFNADLSNDELAVCDWITTGSEFATAQVMIVTSAGGYDLAKEGHASISSLVDVTMSGADAAFRTEEGSIVGMSIAGTYLQVSYIPPGPGNVGDMTMQLAAEAITRYE